MSEGVGPRRRRQILEALAGELERQPGRRITTARLADLVGVSEAALYRHFPSKAGMFEALIEFAEESVFSAASAVLREQADPVVRCEHLLRAMLLFAGRNPGITRVLLGEALVGEGEDLRSRVARFFERMEAQLRAVLREANATPSRPRVVDSPALAAALMMAVIEGRMRQSLRRRDPVQDDWDRQWVLLRRGLFAGQADQG